MKTLVIHPSDRSTDFLKIIYENHLDDWTIINDCVINKEKLRNLINSHDRIIMLGHGTSCGLLNPTCYGYIIDESYIDLLKDKETISIWCNSDSFFKKYNLKGFHTGMIISEVSEEYYILGYSPLNKEEILNNMIKFSNIVKECINKKPEEMKEYILNNYIFNDDVTRFNKKNIIVLC